MRILVACEFSGVVRDAFIARGHDAWSCDLIPSERPGPHLQCDVLTILDKGWDMMLAFPPCTYLCSSGLHWNYRRPERRALTEAALVFVRKLLDAPIPRIALENPIGCIGPRIRKADQWIQPWQFGDPFNKATGLWLKNLPPLVPTKIVDKGKFYTRKNGVRMAAWLHRISGTRHAERHRVASRTFPGIAAAMADQWGK